MQNSKQLQSTRSPIDFEILNDFCYVACYSGLESEDFVIIIDFDFLYICFDKESFCRECFNFHYFNYLTSKSLQGIYSFKFNQEDLLKLFDLKYDLVLKTTLKHENLSKKSWYKIGKSNSITHFNILKHDLCKKCSKREIFNSNSKSFEKLGDLFVKSFLDGIKTNNPKNNLYNLEDKILNQWGTICFFNNYSLKDEGFKKYCSVLLSQTFDLKKNNNKFLCSSVDSRLWKSKLKALMEFVERYSLMNHSLNSSILQASDGFYSWGFDVINKTKTLLKIGERIENPKYNLFFKPSSSGGFAAHINLKQALENSILELLEKDSLMNWWNKPEDVIAIDPSIRFSNVMKTILNKVVEIVKNQSLTIKLFLLPSKGNIPVVLALLCSLDVAKAPALIVGSGAAFDLNIAIEKALNELISSTLNINSKAKQNPNWFLECPSDFFDIKNSYQHADLYYYSNYSSRLKFLPLITQFEEQKINVDKFCKNLDELIRVFAQQQMQWLAFDVTPGVFKDCEVVVVRSVSKDLKEIKFGRESLENKNMISQFSVADVMPHCFS